MENEISKTDSQFKPHWTSYFLYSIAELFGFVLIKSEVVSWYRIQEMFRLQSFYMYGVIGSAILTGIISIQVIKKFKVKSINGNDIKIENKKFNKGQILGG